VSEDFAPEALADLWRNRRPEGPPIGHTFKWTYADRWVRFHSLPESKRYPEAEDEYAILLQRYNTVLDDLFSGQDIFVVTSDWSYTLTGPAGYPEPRESLHPEGTHWWTESEQDDPEAEFHVHSRLYASRRKWEPGCVDDLFRAVADDKVADVFVTDTELLRIHHPYDGGADVILPTMDERDRLRSKHAAWLPTNSAGL
jgi:hypothetical protein